MVLQWDIGLAVGHAEIDGQHQEIFRRFAALVAAMERGDNGAIGPLFEFLGGYTASHFALEERAMVATRYPGANVHAAAHARFLREYSQLRALYDGNGATTGIAVKTRTWIGDWLKAHIMGVDRVARAPSALDAEREPLPGERRA